MTNSEFSARRFMPQSWSTWMQTVGRERVALAAGMLFLAFGYAATEVVEGETTLFDRTIMLALRNGVDPIGPVWLQEMGRDITALGSFAFIGLLLIVSSFYLLIVRKHGTAILLNATVLSGLALSTLLKLAFDRPRPDLVPHATRVFTASFPSGHTMLSTITFLTLGVVLSSTTIDRRLKVFFLSVALFSSAIVGLSRIYLGVHYPTDVLAGWCVGAGWALLSWRIALWLQSRGQVEHPK